MNDIRLSKNFMLSEFECKDGNHEVKLTKELLDKLEILRYYLGSNPLVINSAYRTPEYNQKIGGSPRSKHMEGIAVDIRKVEGFTIDEMAKEAEKAGFTGIGKYNTFIHCDLRPYDARWDLRNEGGE